MLPTEIEYGDLRAKYREEDTRGIPMSVRERYERSLASLREQLRKRPHARPIGQILVEMEVIQPDVLARALSEQVADQGGCLLGEVLVRHGWADFDAIRRAVEQQASKCAEGRECGGAEARSVKGDSIVWERRANWE